MAKKSLPPLSAAEQAMMDILWKKHPASVLDLLEAVNQGRERARHAQHAANPAHPPRSQRLDRAR
jgi:hypothetical protein